MPNAHATPLRALRWCAAVALAFAVACNSDGSSSGHENPPSSTTFTVHYHRALADYDGWQVATTGGAVEASAASTQRDGFGAVYALTLQSGATSLAFSLQKDATPDAAGALTVDVSGDVREAWVFSGWPEAITRPLPALPTTSQFAVYYLRRDADYTGWGLHTWGDQVHETNWVAPLMPKGTDAELGAGYVFDRAAGTAGNCPAGKVCFLVHNGDVKDPGPDMSWDPAVLGNIVFVVSGSTDVTAAPRKLAAVSIAGASAHLVARDTLVWKVTDPTATAFELRTSPTAAIAATETDVTGGTVIPLTARAAGLTDAQKALVPHLVGAEWKVFDVGADRATVEAALRGQLVAVARKADGKPAVATQVQTAFALDDLYPYTGPLGVAFDGAGAPTFRLWAPTAQTLTLHVYDAAKAEVAGSPVTPQRSADGVWTYAAGPEWKNLFYRYELDVYHPLTGKVEHVTVTDPWATNLSTNSRYAQAVDLADPALKPTGWDALAKPALGAPEDIVVYESHVRDFSANDPTVPDAMRGKYLAFSTDAGTTDGRVHLADLAAAGLTHVHLLPVFDIATVDEDPANRIDLDQPFTELCAKVSVSTCGQFAGKTIREALASLPGDSEQQQEIATAMHGLDSFNWGYDPLHYGAPEGSYASTAEGTARVVEFRKMVAGLADLGLRVVMDVVYNHTNASGVTDKSVLDKVVPGYFHRLNAETGAVESSSCCANTATEHAMMEKLMVDTLVRWARDYKVDGFRFDLMGLHLKPDILKAHDALAALTPGADGVDGSKIYLYGEGWSMGELQADARRTLAATQENMAGTGIGTFNDRIRDGVRGGGPFDSKTDLRAKQGFTNGLFLDPNELNSGSTTERDLLAAATDLIRTGMAGGLKNFRLAKASNGVVVNASVIGYGGARAGYTSDPQEDINYCSAHDNQVLFDILSYKLPTGTPMADRVRAQELALDIVMLGEGIPFFHMGDDLLRSKSMERDSFDSGDWFNRVDWSGQTTAWKSGLPNAGKDQDNWPTIRPIFADASIAPSATDIGRSAAHFQEMLRIRKSSRLFRLGTEAEVLKRVDFLNVGTTAVPGVVVMTVSDGTCAGADLDPDRDGLVVVVNADKKANTVTVPGAASAVLHAVQAGSPDVVHTATAVASGADGVLTVPARTTAVFVLPQDTAAAFPCNAR